MLAKVGWALAATVALGFAAFALFTFFDLDESTRRFRLLLGLGGGSTIGVIYALQALGRIEKRLSDIQARLPYDLD